MIQPEEINGLSKLAKQWSNCFRSLNRTFIAAKSNSGWDLRHAIFLFSPEPVLNKADQLLIITDNLIAGRDSSPVSIDSLTQFIADLSSEKISIGAGKHILQFGNNQLDSYFHRQRHPRVSGSMRLPSLFITSRTSVNSLANPDMLDLELRSHDMPFDGVADLLNTHVMERISHSAF